MSKKASMDELNTLHDMVARQLATGLDDPKTLALAIKFLKDNDITADITESEDAMSLTESIKQIAMESGTGAMTVEDMLKNAH